MGRKKKIPDHSAIPSGQRHSTTKNEAEKLISKYGFSDDFPLRDRLDGAYSEEHLARRKESDSMKNVRKLLNELGRRCDAVNEVLGKLGPGEFEFINSIYWIPDGNKDKGKNKTKGKDRNEGKELVLNKQREMVRNLGLLGEDATRMARLVDAALDLEGHAGRRENIPVRVFVEELAIIWKEGTGREPTCSNDYAKNCFTGDFYKFTLRCAEIGGIKLSTGDPGSTIHLILRKLKVTAKIIGS